MSDTDDANSAGLIDPVKSSVKRRLFSPTEPAAEDDQLFDLHMALFTINKEARERWNFDFEKEEPLPGRWLWEKVMTPKLSVKRPGFSDPSEQSNQRKKPTNDFHQISLSDEHREVASGGVEDSAAEEEPLLGQVNEVEANNNLNDSNS